MRTPEITWPWSCPRSTMQLTSRHFPWPTYKCRVVGPGLNSKSEATSLVLDRPVLFLPESNLRGSSDKTMHARNILHSPWSWHLPSLVLQWSTILQQWFSSTATCTLTLHIPHNTHRSSSSRSSQVVERRLGNGSHSSAQLIFWTSMGGETSQIPVIKTRIKENFHCHLKVST